MKSSNSFVLANRRTSGCSGPGLALLALRPLSLGVRCPQLLRCVAMSGLSGRWME
jgi:hypothetical protein